MSRRAKILLVGLFVILLGISLGYLWVAWRPVNPLSFHIIGRSEVKVEGMFDPFSGQSGWTYEIEVRNASAATIRLVSTSVTWLNPDGPAKHIGNLDMGSSPFTDPEWDSTLLIPAHGTARSRMTVYDGSSNNRAVEDAEVGYQWISRVRDDASRRLKAIKDHLRLSDSYRGLPYDYSSNPFDESTAPLQWSSTMPRRQTPAEQPPHVPSR